MEKIKDVKIAMIVAASKTLDYLKENKNADIEEVMGHILKEIRADDKAMLGAIAATNFVYKYKMKHYLASQKEVMKNLSSSTDMLLEKIEVDTQ